MSRTEIGISYGPEQSAEFFNKVTYSLYRSKYWYQNGSLHMQNVFKNYIKISSISVFQYQDYNVVLVIVLRSRCWILKLHLNLTREYYLQLHFQNKLFWSLLLPRTDSFVIISKSNITNIDHEFHKIKSKRILNSK